jgi:hypothetical protein
MGQQQTEQQTQVVEVVGPLAQTATLQVEADQVL